MSRLPYGIAAAVVIVWAAAVEAGLGRALLGPDATPGAEALLVLPAVLVAVALCLYAARQRLRPVADRWRPGLAVHGFERRAERPAPARPPVPRPDAAPLPDPRDGGPPTPAAAASPTPDRAPSRPAGTELVTLGASADPAYASWLLRWDAGDLGRGAIVLPSGEHVLLGRDPDGDLIAHIDQISWHHAELRVQRDGVEIMDLGSTNGTWHVTDDDEVKLDPRRPAALAAWERIQVASPAALTLTLEPLS